MAVCTTLSVVSQHWSNIGWMCGDYLAELTVNSNDVFCFNVGTLSTTLGQHLKSIGSIYVVCLESTPALPTSNLAPSWTWSWRFEPQIAPVKNRGTFLWTVISKTWHRIIRSEIDLLESVTFQLHDRMLSSSSAQSSKMYGHISDLGGRERSQSPSCWKTLIFQGKTNTAIHSSPADDQLNLPDAADSTNIISGDRSAVVT